MEDLFDVLSPLYLEIEAPLGGGSSIP